MRDELSKEQLLALKHANYDSRDDEIDLKELFLTLWQGKYIIIACTLICTVIASYYALNAKVKNNWQVDAIITVPQVSDFAPYQKLVKDFQPVFDSYQQAGLGDQVSLDALLNPLQLFQIFTQQYQSQANKKAYIYASKDFRASVNGYRDNEDSSAAAIREAEQYASRSSSLTSSRLNDRSSEYAQTIDSESFLLQARSLSELQEYVAFVEERSQEVALNNLKAIVSAKQSELLNRKELLTALDRKHENSDDVNQAIYPISSSLLEVDSKLKLIEKIQIPDQLDFSLGSFVKAPEQLLTRTYPKKKLIVVLGFLLGGMLGCAIVLVRFAFKDK